MSNETSAPAQLRPLRVLVVGAGMYVCGRGTDGLGTVLPALYQASRQGALVESITVCATSKSSVDQLAEKHEELARVFGYRLPLELLPAEGRDPKAYRKLLAERADDFDCAILVVPDDLHYETALHSIEAGLHTFLVKPFVPSLDEGLDLVQKAAAANLYCGVEFHKRFDQSNIKMRDELRAGRIGDPLYFHIEYSQRKVIPEQVFAAWAERTNIFQYLGVHYADLIHFLLDAEPRRVMAVGQRQWLVAKGIDTWDAVQVMIEWDNAGKSFVSTHLTNWIDPDVTSAMSDQKIKVIGTYGRIEGEQKHRGLQIVTDDGGIEDVNPYFSQFYGDLDDNSKTFAGYGCQSFLSFLGDVQSVVAGEREPASLGGLRPTFRSSLVSTAIVDAANQSLAGEGEWIDIDSRLNDYL